MQIGLSGVLKPFKSISTIFFEQKKKKKLRQTSCYKPTTTPCTLPGSISSENNIKPMRSLKQGLIKHSLRNNSN